MQTLDFERCAWCNDFLKDSDWVDQGVCQTCSRELGQLPDLNLEAVSREFVDKLPYGNIVLDPNDIVIRYNATEAKYTGYDASIIEGKNFFDDVAPCTNVDSFYGILKEYRDDVEQKNRQYLFKFNFNHPNFRSIVSILMTYYSNGFVVLSIKKLKEL